jgi:transcriptional regulator GlxA family with amidase domain
LVLAADSDAAHHEPMPDRSAGTRVAIVAYPDVMSLDVTGPLEVFALAHVRVTPGYDITLVAPDPGTVRCSSGLRLVADRGIEEIDDIDGNDGGIDTLVVAGGPGTVGAIANPDLIDWIRRVGRDCRRVTSVCSGAFLLAAAGLLDGRRATTHWSVCDLLTHHFPSVDVDPDRIFVRDGPVWTSAGVTAGMDLALALVEHDHGPAVALDVARQLVLYTQRAGGQSQFSTHLTARPTDDEPIRAVLAHIADNLAADLSVPALARRAAMSPRTFARTFRAEAGTTPAAFVTAARVEAARRLLETSGIGTAQIARTCGFGTVETMHRAFRRTVHTTPGQYRRHFAAVREPVPA